MISTSVSRVWFTIAFFAAIFSQSVVNGQARSPFKKGDQVEVHYLSAWRQGVVQEYAKKQVLVAFKFVGEERRVFSLDQVRFPNDEGVWMNWTDESGQFRITARRISNTDTHVTLLKEDGKTIDVPINKLSSSLQSQVQKLLAREKEFTDAAFVRVGDVVEYKSFSGWFRATVNRLLPDGAQVTVVDTVTNETKTVDAKYPSLRYPNGEGPWADWTDSTGKHSIKARYLTHDKDKVWLLREGNKKIGFDRSKLDATIVEELDRRLVISRRPEEKAFDVSSGQTLVEVSSIRYGADSPAWPQFKVKLNVDGAETTSPLSVGVYKLPIMNEKAFRDRNHVPNAGESKNHSPSTSAARASIGKIIAFPTGLSRVLGLWYTPSKPSPYDATTLYWLDLNSMQVLQGPNFSEGEKILGYSASQQRLLTTEGIRDLPSRFCSYRLSPMSDDAVPETSWPVPEVSGASSDTGVDVRFTGTSGALIRAKNTISRWDIDNEMMEFIELTRGGKLVFSPQANYIIIDAFFRRLFLDSATGKILGHVSNGQPIFSDDGRFILISEHYQTQVFDPSGVKLATLATTVSGDILQIVDKQWISTDQGLWNLDRDMQVWSFALNGLTAIHSFMDGDKIVRISVKDKNENFPTVYVSVMEQVPEVVLNSIESAQKQDLFVVRPGISVRIDESANKPEMISGIRRAMHKHGWTEDPKSKVAIHASAANGARQERVFQQTKDPFGRLDSSGGASVTVSAAPWIQSVSIVADGGTLWSQSSGSVPSYLEAKDSSGVQAEFQKRELPSYTLFDSFEFPERIMASKYSKGFGKSTLTPDGIIHRPVE